MTHAALVSSVLEYLTLRGIPCSETDASRAFGQDGEPRESKVREGWPDITGCLPPHGRMLAVECKVGKDKLSDVQERMLDALWRAGAYVIVARSMGDVHRELAKMGRDTGRVIG